MEQVLQWIGNTPIYHLKDSKIFIKLEQFNFTGSIKDRAVLAMFLNAKKQNKVKQDTILIEASSGNTGISLAMIGAVFHIPVCIVMPDTMSIERKKLLQVYGAQIELSEGSKGMQGAICKMNEIMKKNKNYLCLHQFENEENTKIHYQTTGVEILKQVPNIDIFVACGGSCGTFCGVSKFLKEQNAKIRCVYGEPTSCAMLSMNVANSHSIQGIGANFVPNLMDRKLVDDIMLIEEEDAFMTMQSFVKETGIFVGPSSGANIALAKRLAFYYPNKNIVTIAADRGERYLSMLDNI